MRRLFDTRLRGEARTLQERHRCRLAWGPAELDFLVSKVPVGHTTLPVCDVLLRWGFTKSTPQAGGAVCPSEPADVSSSARCSAPWDPPRLKTAKANKPPRVASFAKPVRECFHLGLHRCTHATCKFCNRAIAHENAALPCLETMHDCGQNASAGGFRGQLHDRGGEGGVHRHDAACEPPAAPMACGSGATRYPSGASAN